MIRQSQSDAGSCYTDTARQQGLSRQSRTALCYAVKMKPQTNRSHLHHGNTGNRANQTSKRQQKMNNTHSNVKAGGKSGAYADSSRATSTGRGPQHGAQPQLMANLAVPPPMFPSAGILSQGGAILSMPDTYGMGAMQGSVVLGNNDLFAQMSGVQNSLSVTPQNPFQHMGMPPHLSVPPPFREGSNQRGSSSVNSTDLNATERAKQNRDRNREHARSTRLRKKAYVAKLKDLVEGLHSQRTEDMRQRRIAIQHLSEIQSVRRNVIRTFLKYFCCHEQSERKWSTLIEDTCWMKEPVTPYRSFRRTEIEKDCHVSKGLDSIMNNSASLSIMIESIGSRSARWMQLKRREFMVLEEAQRETKKVPACLVRQPSRLHHAISSLSSSSDAVGGEDSTSRSEEKPAIVMMVTENSGPNDSTTKVSSSSGSSNDGSDNKQDSSNVYHDYNAMPLPDPKLGETESSVPSRDDSPEDFDDSKKQGQITTDSSSSDDADASQVEGPANKKRKTETSSESASGSLLESQASSVGPTMTKKGGIPHNVVPVINNATLPNGKARLEMTPAVALPTFTGLGKRSNISAVSVSQSGNNATVKTAVRSTTGNVTGSSGTCADAESSSASSDSDKVPRISAHFHINEDDMIMMDDILMCPFVFRSSNAVLCGALSETILHGMLRANFSPRNKLASLEMVYDSMGFMQQLERSNGNEGAAQIVPNSLEMALAPSSTEARVITLAKSPFLIVNVNDLWTQTTGYTQMEVEGKPYLSLLDGEATVAAAACERSSRPPYNLEEVAKGRSACMTNIHYDKAGKDFVEFVCSYPLVNSNNETTHLLHVSKELPSLPGNSTYTMS